MFGQQHSSARQDLAAVLPPAPFSRFHSHRGRWPMCTSRLGFIRLRSGRPIWWWLRLEDVMTASQSSSWTLAGTLAPGMRLNSRTL